MTEHERGVFARRLRDLRENAQMTQSVLADKAAIGLSTLCQFEYGMREPTYGTLVKLARALNVSLSAFDVADDEPTTDATPRPRGRPPKAEAAPEPTTKRKRKKEG